MSKLPISEVNRLDVDGAVALLGGIFEHSPWIVRDSWGKAPFSSVTALHAALCHTVRSSPPADQLDLIRAHPDLVGHAARAGTLTPESSGEQLTAGLGPDDLTPEEVDAFTTYNAAYQARFGFPFVICARDNRKTSILNGFQHRLGNDPATERNTAIREIERIAWHRLSDLVVDDPGANR